MTVSRVLVVDDEPLIRWSLGEQLRAAGLEVAEAGDQAEALERARELPDLVLVDYRLPDSDGIAVVRALRKLIPGVRFILMSAEMDRGLERRARQAGCLYCIAKPFRLEEIERQGGSLSHHHGVGKLLAPWMDRHLGSREMGILRALKRHFDPRGVMNPGGTLGLDLDGSRGDG